MNTMPSQYSPQFGGERRVVLFTLSSIHPSIHCYIIREITQVSKQAAPSPEELEGSQGKDPFTWKFCTYFTVKASQDLAQPAMTYDYSLVQIYLEEAAWDSQAARGNHEARLTQLLAETFALQSMSESMHHLTYGHTTHERMDHMLLSMHSRLLMEMDA